jgi:hypothetical protein
MHIADLKPKNQKQRNLYFGVAGLTIVVIGLILAKLFSNQEQDVRNQASTGTGTAEVALTPPKLSLTGGETGSMTISFNTKGQLISGISLRVQYHFVGNEPELVASDLVDIIKNNDSNWNCAVKQINTQSQVVQIDLGCLYQSQKGYKTNNTQTLATFKLTANANAEESVYTLTFDHEETIMTLKSTGEDVAAIPQNTATVNVIVGDNRTANTPTPTMTSDTPTPTQQQSNVSPDKTQAGTLICEQTCQANRDCIDNLACLDDHCRDPRCPDDTTCQCKDRDVAKENNANDLPHSGSIDYTLISLVLGGLFAMGGTSLLAYNLSQKIDDN